MERRFVDRATLIAYVAEQFPLTAVVDRIVSPIQGGRRAAEAVLAEVAPLAYGRTRSHLDGRNTHLSPYLRYGVLSLAEVRDRALVTSAKPGDAWRLINQVSWREYFSRVYAVLGDDIWQDIQPYKTGKSHTAYVDALPPDIRSGTTGAVCIDTWSAELRTAGYLHNHVRLWLASYLIHWRQVRWQAGARWFLEHLLDGDPASNNLSWQWVASTWRFMPYIWNRANLVKNGGGELCERCPLLHNGCPFEGSYAALSKQLFPQRGPAPEDQTHGLGTEQLKVVASATPAVPQASSATVVVWVHGDGLNPHGPALAAYPDAPAVWVWDDALIGEWQLAFKRLVFIYECLVELPVTIRRGDVAAEVAAFARAHGAQVIATTPSPSPRFRAIAARLAEQFTVQVWPEPPYLLHHGPLNLTSHTPYWHQIKRSALLPTGTPPPTDAAPAPKPRAKRRRATPPPPEQPTAEQ